ncbi:ribbon-helix-helix domain-containing protein [Maricaulis sp.]
MSAMERITITLTSEIAALVRGAVETGDYASSSEIIREALRDWREKRLATEHNSAQMRAFIAAGVEDHDQGRVRAFDADDIKTLGRLRSSAADPSA